MACVVALATFLCAQIQLRDGERDCSLARLAGAQDLQAGFVAFGCQANSVRDACVWLEADRFSVRRGVDDTLREAGVECLRKCAAVGGIGEFRPQKSVGIWPHIGEGGVELEVGEAQAGGQLAF